MAVINSKNISQTQRVQLEISVHKLEMLLVSRQLCAADIRCPSCASRNVVKHLCLKACVLRNL